MSYRLIRTLGDGNERTFAQGPRGLAVDGDDRIYATANSHVVVFDSEGRQLRRWPTHRDGYSVAVDSRPPGASPGRTVWVGQAGQIEIFDSSGGLVDTWADDERLGLVTALGFTADGVLAADAVSRWIRHYDRQGRWRNNIGDQHRKGGFHIPNGVVDFAVDQEGVVHVANPGMHRVERYTPAGDLLGHVGRFGGGDPEGAPVTFGGCCNPTNVALASDGRVIVTEKAGPRAKVYRDGRLLSVVAEGEVFDPAAKNMDVVVDSRGRIYVADTVRRRICVFEPAVGQEGVVS